ncbi:MAG: hypothetical protein AB4058_12785, partial [Microcystaceae cyanobacterium]
MSTTADDIWQILAELANSQKETERILRAERQETERRFQETERILREERQETQRLAQETERQRQETQRLAQETERQIKEVNQQIKEVNQQIGKLGNRLGEFVEWQVRPAAVRLFQERGIEVHALSKEISAQRGNEGLEIDLLVVNDTDVILVEVKSKLSQRDVDDHLERLAKFKEFMPRYADTRALGAVAGMIVPSDVARYAYRKGLFVLAQSGETVIILNDAKF